MVPVVSHSMSISFKFSVLILGVGGTIVVTSSQNQQTVIQQKIKENNSNATKFSYSCS